MRRRHGKCRARADSEICGNIARGSTADHQGPAASSGERFLWAGGHGIGMTGRDVSVVLVTLSVIAGRGWVDITSSVPNPVKLGKS